MNYDNIFIEGQEISGRLGDRVIEGTIYIQDNGTRVVLNEATGKWTKLRNLTHIKPIGTILYEDEAAMEAGKEVEAIMDKALGPIDPKLFKSDKDIEEAGKALGDVISADDELKNGLKATGVDIGNKDAVYQTTTDHVKAKISKDNATEKGGGDVEKAMQTLKNYQSMQGGT